MTKILGFFGNKSSGKSSAANYIVGLVMRNTQVEIDDEWVPLLDWVDLNSIGQIVVPSSEGPGILDLNNPDKAFQEWLDEFVHPHVRIFSWAKEIKRALIELFGLPYELVYGDETAKNTPTQYTWKQTGFRKPKGAKPDDFLTVRQMMQGYATNIRCINDTAFVDKTLRDIEASGTELAIIDDGRHLIEAEGLAKAGGRTIRLTGGAKGDEHSSEVEINSIETSAVITDDNMADAHKTLFTLLQSWEYL